MIRKPLTFISLASEDYLRFISALIISAEKFYPEVSFYVVLINVEKEKAIKLKSLHHDCKIIYRRIKFPSEQYKRCYCAGYRADLLNIVREERPNDILMWIDADSIFMKRDDELFNHVNNCDVSMKPKPIGGDRYASGVISINNTENGKDFAKKYYKYSKKGFNRLDWFNDQKMLRKTYIKLKKRINFKPLPFKYCDTHMSKEGVIWTAKGNTRSNERFINSIKNILGKFQDFF